MRAELIAIGTELLLGEIVDTNSPFLARKLAEYGINLYYISTVGDNLQRGLQVLARALDRSDLIIITGGLGPTDDDLTREIVSVATGCELVEDEAVWQELIRWFERRYGGDFVIPIHNRKQALFPRGSKVLSNTAGTAPGFWLDVNDISIVALPGVPGELKTMFAKGVEPALQLACAGQRLVTRNLNFIGIGESRLEDMLADLFAEQSNPTLALYVRGGKVRIRLTARAGSRQAGLELIAPLENEITKRAGDYLYSKDDKTLGAIIGEQLIRHRLCVAVAESCTGGLISHTLTNVPGSSAYFQRAYIVYSNQAKQEDLGVPAHLFTQFGAVSQEVAQAMAEGVRRKARVDFGLAVTGIAGPGGGSPEKPVGLTYIALASSGDTIVERHLWQGSREEIKDRTALAALRLLWLKSRC